jgi:hypothetical protein
MSLPTQDNVLTLDFADQGQPWADVEAKQLYTNTLDFAYMGLPWVGIAPGSTPPPTYNATQFFMMF